MPVSNKSDLQPVHSELMNDIIRAAPGWLMRSGITATACIFVIIVSLSALIKYPEVVKTQLRLVSLNSPKPVIARTSGRLTRIMVVENTLVKKGQILAFVESTADPTAVLELLSQLKHLQQMIANGNMIEDNLDNLNQNYGELQSSYQAFYQTYLSYKNADRGFYLSKKKYLYKDLADLKKQSEQLEAQKALQLSDLKLGDEDLSMHKKLAEEKVETPAEFREIQSKYLGKKAPLLQTEAALINASNNQSAKQKEILELNNTLHEEKAKFYQALNSLLSQILDWKTKYILESLSDGQVVYSGAIQQNQFISAGQEVFYINSPRNQFYGEMAIPQENMGRIRKGQRVLIKMRGYPFEEYGMVMGRITQLNEVPYKDSLFVSKVSLNTNEQTNLKKRIQFKQGMLADADIVTDDVTILQRIYRSLVKSSSMQ